jgi:hypothetical protein
MNDIISEYQEWKQHGEDLRAKAKQAIESRFRELLAEAIQLAEEYRTDFGMALKPPPPVTAFRYKPGAKKTAGRRKPAPKPAAPPVKQPAPKPDRKVAGLQKRLSTAQKKLDAAKAAGAPTKDLDDKIYEIQDALRLAGGTQ